MELTEPIESINRQLTINFGKHLDGRPKFRVVWSDDQIEKRQSYHSPEGIQYIHPRVIEVPKYIEEHSKHRYILEQLSVVPDSDRELLEPFSYEPLWVFSDRHGKYLPPAFWACQIIINQVYESIDKANRGIKKYVNPDDVKGSDAVLSEVEELLFGEETPVTDALAYGYGVTVPHNYEKKETSNGTDE